MDAARPLLKSKARPMTADFYESFNQYLLTGDTSKIKKHLARSSDIDRLKVYRNGFFRSSISALRSNFPTVLLYLGGKQFDSFAKKFVSSEPSRHSQLQKYGESFSLALENVDNFVASTAKNAASLAILDDAWRSSMHHSAVQPMQSEQLISLLAELTETGVALLHAEISSGVNIVKLPSSVFSAWIKYREQTDYQLDEELPEIEQYLIFWPTGNSVLFRELSEAEYAFLLAIRNTNDNSIAEACETVLQSYPQFDVAVTLTGLLNSGLLRIGKNNEREKNVIKID